MSDKVEKLLAMKKEIRETEGKIEQIENEQQEAEKELLKEKEKQVAKGDYGKKLAAEINADEEEAKKAEKHYFDN
jgi:TolA-binding protein